MSKMDEKVKNMENDMKKKKKNKEEEDKFSEVMGKF
jgi:hypothetical protein